MSHIYVSTKVYLEATMSKDKYGIVLSCYNKDNHGDNTISNFIVKIKME